ncbi:RNA-binding S4 domain-containing protein [bacterium]|nr:RNA-binding S4 domain-containing protein [bacterium]
MEPTIKLDQFLKREGFAFSGGDAKQMIQAGVVLVNGEVETRRGRQLKSGDSVSVEDVTKVVDDLRD